MDLFEGYVRWLRLFLPKEQRDDIIRELSEEHHSRVAEKEAALGRPLSRDEHAALIAQYGHPLLMAARYRPQQHLIGPVLYPFYWPVLKVTIGIAIVVHAISGVVLIAGGTPIAEVARIVGQAWYAAIAVFAWVTIAFAIGDRQLARGRVLEKWNPNQPGQHVGSAVAQAMAHSAGAAGHAARAGEIAERAVNRVYRHGPPVWHEHLTWRSQRSSLSGFVMGVILSVWWLLALKFPYLMFGGGAAILGWGPDMDRLYPVLFVATVLSLAEHFVRLTRPQNMRFFRVTRVMWLIGCGFFIYFLLTLDHQWVVWRGAEEARARFNFVAHIAGRDLSLVDLVNYAFTIPFIFAASLGVCTAVMRVLQWLFRRRPRAAHV